MKLGTRSRRRGSLLVVVISIAFGMVSLALVFGHTMMMENRISDNELAQMQASQAIDGMVHYIKYVLTNNPNPGYLPDPTTYANADVQIGEARCWLIGRDPNADGTQTVPTFGLVDEASKLNLNTATEDMLDMLPNMPQELAGSIINWRSSGEESSGTGVTSDYYSQLNPPYTAKASAFETVDELRLVYGSSMSVLYGEDANLNGALDPNEDDGDVTPPNDDRDGHLLEGILDDVTAWSREPSASTANSTLIDVSQANNAGLENVLSQALGDSRAQTIMSQLGGYAATSLLDFYTASGMTLDEFNQVADQLTASGSGSGTTNANPGVGLVNVDTASADVLACIPGIGTNYAQSLVDYRKGKTFDDLKSVGWVADVLDASSAQEAGPYITTRSYQFSADVAAVGRNGRGFKRVLFIFDTQSGTPKVIYRQDLTYLGWPLGAQLRKTLSQPASEVTKS